jgi:dipeptidyl aminopeptidase/acylaminoacyl peptidase
MPRKYLLVSLIIFILIFFFIGWEFPKMAKKYDSPSIIVTAPNGGETWTPGSNQTISWRYTGITAREITGQVEINLLKGGALHKVITHNASPGSDSGGSFSWQVPLFIAQGKDYKVQLIAYYRSPRDPLLDIQMTDESDGYFTILSGGKIVFVSLPEGSTTGDIFLMDETGLKNLTNSPENEEDPAISSGGDKVAFASGYSREIYTINIDGTARRRLTSNSSDDLHPYWSPTGDKIVFCSNRDRNYEIYIMNADGTNPQRLTNNPADDVAPSWSPAGDKIAFVSTRDGNNEIYTMNADGSNLRRLTTSPANDTDPVWSPDSSKIAFCSDRNGTFDIFIMNADGTGLRPLTTGPNNERHPTWSLDGTRIVYSHNSYGPYLLAIKNLSDRSETMLLDSKNPAWGPSWSPRPPLSLKPGLLAPKRIIKK